MFLPVKISIKGSDEKQVVTFENWEKGMRMIWNKIESDGDWTKTAEKLIPWSEVVELFENAVDSQRDRYEEMFLESEDDDFAEFCKENISRIDTVRSKEIENGPDKCNMLYARIDDEDLAENIIDRLI